MFVDASAIVAVLGREPGFEEIVKRLGGEVSSLFVSPLVRFEAVLALSRKKATSGPGMAKPSPELIIQARAAVDEFVEAIGAEEIAVTSQIGALALDASMTYGKAVGHPADLNFGDCFAYACAKSLQTTLVYKGHDFARTDLA